MVKVSILYPNQPNSRFDSDYYLSRHMPATIEMLAPALKGVSVEQGIAGGVPGVEPPYIVMCHLLFDSLEAFQTAFAPHAEERVADIANYTDIQPLIQISEVKISR